MDGTREHRRATAWFQQARTAQPRGSPPGTGRTAGRAVMAALDDADSHDREAPRLYRFVAGVDRQARPLDVQELAELSDPMAALFFRKGTFPLTVHDLLAGLPEPATQENQSVYLIGEAGQIPPGSASELPRAMRFAVARAATGRDVDLLVSTGANEDPAATFLQVAAWDPATKVFNYYMRISPVWVWAGNSWSALAPGSRGHGCFDSHINGSAVMKELKAPWSNWESQAATIRLAADDPFRNDALYQQVIGAENLELTVRALIGRWTAARLAAVTQDGTVEHPEQLMRHLFTTTTVNLASTATQSSTISPSSGDLLLPPGFWLNSDALLGDLELPVTAAVPPMAPAAHYVASLAAFDFALEEKSSGFSQPGDSFFAFVVPEAACEDNDVVRQMVEQGLITPRFAACALMADFTNPVFSPVRGQLMAHVPTSPTAVTELQDHIAQAILHAATSLPPGSPEGRFAADWALAEDAWPKAFAQRIDDYLGHVGRRIREPSGFDDYVRLAESRRRDFKAMRLHEFELTLPTTNIPADAPRLRMSEAGMVAPAS
ncbi:hypothetical protein AB0E10_27415 [Streptomyces sp. NPDC048045]|uniref:hypothetical protein n=1 Tax=Streptomyces sp. NPDC048045 TaxID=3154710 RepID=UPI003413BE42